MKNLRLKEYNQARSHTVSGKQPAPPLCSPCLQARSLPHDTEVSSLSVTGERVCQSGKVPGRWRKGEGCQQYTRRMGNEREKCEQEMPTMTSFSPDRTACAPRLPAHQRFSASRPEERERGREERASEARAVESAPPTPTAGLPRRGERSRAAG